MLFLHVWEIIDTPCNWYLDHIHVRRAAGDWVVHLPHLTVAFHSDQFDGDSNASPCENGRVHHLCVLGVRIVEEKSFIQ